MPETLVMGPDYAELAKKVLKLAPDHFSQAHFSMLSLMIRHNVSLDDAVQTANALIDNEDPDIVGKRAKNLAAKEEIKNLISSLPS